MTDRQERKPKSPLAGATLTLMVFIATWSCKSSPEKTDPSTQSLADCKSVVEQTDPFNSAIMVDDTAIVIAEPGAQVVLRIRWPGLRIDTVGHLGEGPGEYQRPMVVFSQPGGRVAILDAQLRRLLIVAAVGTIENVRLPQGIDPFSVVLDSLGRVYGFAPYFPSTGAPPSADFRDSIPLLRWTTPESRPDTLGFVLAPLVATTRRESATSYREVLYSERDVWGVFPDGTIWIARGKRQTNRHATRRGYLAARTGDRVHPVPNVICGPSVFTSEIRRRSGGVHGQDQGAVRPRRGSARRLRMAPYSSEGWLWGGDLSDVHDRRLAGGYL